MISSENKVLLQSDVVFDSESNGHSFNSLAPSGGEKKIIFNFFLQNDVASWRRRFFRFFELEIENIFFSPPDGTRELK